MTDQITRHVCLISGGKDSTALAIYMRDHHPEIEMEYVFNDTHKELDETYEFLTRVEAYLGKPIIRLTSDLAERGFDHWLQMYGGFLPSPSVRWCTRKLKIEPFEEYIGDAAVCLYIGIRADEHREGYISNKPNIIPQYPFKDAGITKDDVIRILEESGVGMPSYYEWRTRSGCYFCFFQRKAEWAGLLQNHPDLYEQAMAYEKPEEGYTWVQKESLQELARPARIEIIRADEAKRKIQEAKRRKPKTLAAMFDADTEDPDESVGCLMCHL